MRSLVGGATSYDYQCSRIGCSRSDRFIAVARFLSDGRVDSTFGGDGTVEEDFGFQRNARPSAFAVQPDGRVLIAGTGSHSEAFVARLTADGALDPSFAGDGVMNLELPNLQRVGDMALAPGGRIVVGGTTDGAQLSQYNFDRDHLVFRLLDDGALDPAFGGGDGIVTLDLSLHDEVKELAVDAAGRVVGAGEYWTGAGYAVNTAVFRLLVDGSPDPSFSGDGSLHADLVPERPSNENVSELLIDGADRALLSISAFRQPTGAPPGERQLRALVRYEPDGTADAGFGPEGSEVHRRRSERQSGDPGLRLRWAPSLSMTTAGSW